MISEFTINKDKLGGGNPITLTPKKILLYDFVRIEN